MSLGFTAERDLLLAAISSKKAAPSFPIYLSRPAAIAGRDSDLSVVVKAEFRRQLTLDSLNQLCRYLGQIPGRKNLLWFSSSFPISILPNGDDPESMRPGYVDEFRETVNLLAHYQVAVFPIDARGLTTAPTLDDPNSGPVHGGPIPLVPSQNDAFYSANAGRLSAMNAIAEANGGEAFANTNGFKEAASRAVDAGSNYYTIAYTPANDKWNGKYRKIQIEVDRKGLTLGYRRGYYATEPNIPVQKKKASAATTPEGAEPGTYSAMHSAMVYGAPEPTQILFSAIVRPSISGEGPAVYPHNQPGPAAKGPFRRYNVHYKAHLEDIHCDPTPLGPLHCAVEFVACVYDADGLLINTQVNDIRETVKSADFAALHRPGLHPEFQYSQDISVPVKGEYYLRVGLHDLLTNHVGALELPVATVSQLPPTAPRSVASTSNPIPR